MCDDHSVNLSEDEEDIENGFTQPELHGTLSKWTNYIHGWQDRYIVLKDGTLAYYKSEDDTAYGCRGAISIFKAVIKPHEFDECRFDVSVHDCVWYLRAETPEERNRWVETLEAYKGDSAYGSENSLRRHGSAVSVGSTSLSNASITSFKKARGLRVKLAEMETFKDILCRQVDTLQSYFDVCAEMLKDEGHKDNDVHMDDIDEDYDENAGHSTLVTKELLAQHGAHAVDFRGEAITFKATTSGILNTLSHCIELLSQREENWKRRLEKEVEKRKKLEEAYKQALSEVKSIRPVVLGGPDYEEGPHSMINEDEFFDAVDAALDRSEQQEEEKRLSRSYNLETKSPMSPSIALNHPLWPEIDDVTLEQLKYAKMGVGEGGWQLFAEDGEMRMYRREVEEGGIVCDPLKAVHTVRGVTGHEMCHYFFSPEYRFDWETTVENMKVVEEISSNTLIFHQIHKRVWPATQRDALFWSHMRQVPNDEDKDAHDIWIVCNNSTEHDSTPVGKCVRLIMTVSLVCQTFVDPPTENKEISRENLTCRITYCSSTEKLARSAGVLESMTTTQKMGVRDQRKGQNVLRSKGLKRQNTYSI
ncbi:Ceramide transfer protein like [Argiope bruennichi]|uniref:Ceramide transfer protein like n=1 Tax=Argiope bruennichi TaxID=94029 RepID=A0A8T0FTX1_ARGBR|nr:Ceramide transfer protein like [Argiope bruennichi]